MKNLYCKVAMLRKIFHALEERLKKEMGVDKLSNEYDYEYENEKKLNTFYDHSYSAYPGISYQYKNDVKDGIDIWFRIEIEWRLYAGFCVPIHGKAGKQQLTENEIKEQITHLEPKISDWWAYWEYIPVDDSDISPDFKHPDTNNAYYKLFDQVYFDDFINKCVKRIQEIWK